MNNKTNWNHGGKYFLAMVFASVLLSIFGIFTYNVFADVSIRTNNQASGNHFDNTVLGTQQNPNVKHVTAQTNTNNNVNHVKSPPHIPPSIIIEQYLQSKLCKNKCVHPKSP